jgi:hypothetical protein
MNAKSILRLLVCLTLLPFSTLSTCSASVITFDDLSETGSGSFIPNGYQGLVWNNFYALNAILFPTVFPTHPSNGYYFGMVSVSNVAWTYNPGEIDSPGTSFNFLSAYLTGAWNSNLNIEVKGFRSGALLYDTTVVASATNPTLFTFNYLDIDRLYFNASGGQPAFGTSPAEFVVVDNFTFEFVPEPSSLLLTAGGVLTLWAFLKRKREQSV